MSLNLNNGSEDFVFVHDPVNIAPLKGGAIDTKSCLPPTETDYVTVYNDHLIISAKQDTLMVPKSDEHKQPMVKIRYFEPMVMSAFPEEMTKDILMAPVYTNYQAPEFEANGLTNLTYPHRVLIKNSNLLFECFFHFQPLYPKLGRGSVLYTMGKACELKSEKSSTLKQHVGCILETLREGRLEYLRQDKNKASPRAEDPYVRKLARMVDQYIVFMSEEPREVEKKWYEDPMIENLWFNWQDVLKNKGLRITAGRRRDTVSVYSTERGGLITEAVQAATKLEDALIRLEALGGCGGLTKNERQLIGRALDRVDGWADKIKYRN